MVSYAKVSGDKLLIILCRLNSILEVGIILNNFCDT